jgi:hypothetical protein
MMDYLLTACQTEHLRQQIIDESILPEIQVMFDHYDQLPSAVMLVAQYWNDNARDEVPDLVWYSVLATPDLTAVFKSDDNYESEPINLAGLESWGRQPQLRYPVQEKLVALSLPYQGGAAIPAFDAFCKEGAHQWYGKARSLYPLRHFSPEK